VSYSITHSRPTLRFAELLVAHAQRAASQPEPAGLAEDDLVAHEHRVADLADAIAVALGWGGRRRELLWDAARCHDEGKALISLEILEKPGSLTPQEYAEVTRHPVLGARTLEPFLTIQQVGWVLHHHERWDGQGYPERLARDDIPEGARIIAVADAWDAMTSRRCYRLPIGPAAAIAELWRCAGSQFDPEVVKALTRVGPHRPPISGR
jgi:HD-GYP domain-containing protein (c-di-GMP phosphodiesterase class II)